MIGIFRIALAIAIALGIVAASLFGAKDSRILAAPPERELDVFLIQLANRRYDRAITRLSIDLRRRITADSLRALEDLIAARTGGVRSIDARRGLIRGSRAFAGGILAGERGQFAFDVPMIRERGVWKIGDLTSIRSSLAH